MALGGAGNEASPSASPRPSQAQGAEMSPAVANDAPAPDGADRDDASSTDHVQEKTPPKEPVSKWQKLKAHFWRFKWWYLLGLVILLAIMLPILFKVIIPAIVQSILNSQSLPINGGSLRVLSPNEVMMTLNTSLDTPLGVTIDPLVLRLHQPGMEDVSPFLELHLPKQHVDGKTEVLITNQTVPVGNYTELVSWFSDVFDKPSTKLSIRASPTVRLGALSYHPTLKKTIELPTLNYLKGFGVTDLSFMLSNNTNSTTPNMKGKVNLPNSGELTLGLGNITFNLMTGDVKVGLLTVYDVDLYPGDNIRDFEGFFYFDMLVPNLHSILESQDQALTTGQIEFNVTGNATVVNGQPIPSVQEILKDRPLTFYIPLITLLTDVLAGTMDSDASPLGVFGSVFGNKTLLDNVMHHWDEGRGSNSVKERGLRTMLKRFSPGI